MSRLGYEFAPIDVSITTHPKAFRAGIEAMGLWLWGMAYAKQHNTNGVVHRAAVLGAWGGKRNAGHAKKLVDAGLWVVRDDGDWDIHNFERKGPGRSTSSAERMRELRGRRKKAASDDAPGDTECDVTCDAQSDDCDASHVTENVTECSISISTSVSDLGSREGESEREAPPSRTRASAPDPQGPEPEWWAGVLATIGMDTGVHLPARESWLRYAGHRASKAQREGRPQPATPADAVHWLATVLVPEARKARDQERERRERDAKFDARRAGPLPPSETAKLSEAEQADLAERFPMRRRRGVA